MKKCRIASFLVCVLGSPVAEVIYRGNQSFKLCAAFGVHTASNQATPSVSHSRDWIHFTKVWSFCTKQRDEVSGFFS
jgi:hypothetical protein